METTNKKKKGMIKLIVFILIVLLIAALNHYYGWSDIFSGDDWYGNLQQMVKTNFLQAALIYIVVMVIASVVLAVPGVTFAIIAGAIFGPWWGTLLCVLSATLGAIAAFLVGRFFLQDSLRDQIVKNRYINRLLFDKSTKNEMMVLMITRLVPLFPYNLQNFAYGITDISLGKYSLGTFVFMIPGVAMYTVGTYALTGASNKLLYIGLTAAIVVAVMCMLTGASMSFLGLGVQPPTPEWGAILNEGRTYISYASWMTFYPGLVLAVTGVGLSLLGDSMTEILRRKGR